jgi:hypothetical protein
MQISASNLLVAAQQPQAAPQQVQSGFAQILANAKSEAARFEPASFEPASFATGAAEAGGAKPAPAAQAQPYAPIAAPGTKLDIRI